MSEISPTPERAKHLLKLPKDKPVTMVNLLKFKDQAAYERYTQNVLPLLEKAGGKIVYAGEVAHYLVGDSSWERVVVVEYPSPRNFIRMTASEEYNAIHHDRELGLESTELIATHSMTGE